MFCSRSLNNSLNHIHECALRLTYDDHAHYFQDIIEMTNEETLHQNILKYLAKEMYKLLHGLSPIIMNDIFEVSGYICNLRNFQSLYSTCKKL